MKILVLDNYDSFTYNLVHQVRHLGYACDVVRNDKIDIDDVGRYDKIILSPGPGIPDEAGILKEVIKTYAGSRSLLGVCLGHQAIGEVFGAKLKLLDRVHHGVATKLRRVGSHSILDGLDEGGSIGRYHSWVIDPDTIPDELNITALDEVGEVMAINHNKFDVHGVQFHPESILTKNGISVVESFLGTSTSTSTNTSTSTRGL